MEKPAIFLSHSSADSTALRLLKDFLSEKTGGSVELFLSSDGQSIPLGRNWVHTIQAALEGCQLMFVFLTPASLNSAWLFFESGFAYSKKTRVVPVALFGLDLKEVAPPLNLLQGFNATSAAGLNNLLAVINDVFDHKHAESFTQDEYMAIERVSGTALSGGLGVAANAISTIKIQLNMNENFNINSAAQVLSTAGVEHQSNKYRINWFGASMSSPYNSGQNYSTNLEVSIETWSRVAPVLIGLIREFGRSDEVRLLLVCNINVDVCSGIHNVTARLIDTEVALGSNDRLVYEGVAFQVQSHSAARGREKAVWVEIDSNTEQLANLPILALVDLLFNKHVLFWSKDPLFWST